MIYDLLLKKNELRKYASIPIIKHVINQQSTILDPPLDIDYYGENPYHLPFRPALSFTRIGHGGLGMKQHQYRPTKRT